MLKMIGVKLEHISDIDMHLFIEKDMRGGILYIAKRHSKANNKYIKNYDDSKENIFIMFFDINNLYGGAMAKYLPHSDFKWLTKKEIDITDFNLIKEDSSIGYILEVDLEYPNELHDLHNDYPLAPEKLTNDTLSKYSSDITHRYGIKIGKVNKLILNLGNKRNYVIHYRNLQLYTSLGMKLTKIHKVLKFNQSDWLKKFVDFNTEKKKNASNEFEKKFFKLMINSVFGKTMENLRKRIDVKLINNAKDYKICEQAKFYFTKNI